MYPLVLLSVLLLFKVSIAVCGAVSSGGTKLKRTEINPWFLQNTKDIFYCIEKDADTFFVSEEKLRHIVTEALVRWQKTFEVAVDEIDGTIPMGPKLRVGTQRFFYHACQESTDLRFSFGKLSKADRKFLDTPLEYVAAAIRTHYDFKRLKARGFIYIAPLQGPLKPNWQGIDPEAWRVCDHCLLRVTVWHELGHVFGFQHEAQGLMQSEIGPSLISQDSVRYYRQESIPGQFQAPGEMLLAKMDPMNAVIDIPKKTAQSCMIGSPNFHLDFFEIPQYARCRRLQFQESGMIFGYSRSPFLPFEEAGRIPLQGLKRVRFPLIKVYLPTEQGVFPMPKPEDLNGPVWIFGEYSSTATLHSFYYTLDGQKKPVYMRFLPWQRIEAIGFDQHGLEPDLILNF